MGKCGKCGLRYVEELERRYDALENKCKTQETVIESLSKNYHELKRKHNKAAMHYWMYWFKMDEESAEDLENKGWYLIIIPDCDHPVVAQYEDAYKGFKVARGLENCIYHKNLVKYWAFLPEPELFDTVKNKEEKYMKMIAVQKPLDYCDNSITHSISHNEFMRMDCVDVEPIKHGHWLKKGNWIICSNCNRKIKDKSYNKRRSYIACPYCSAKMDEEEK